MSVTFRYISDKSIWEQFHLATSFPSIFQSWNMGEALKKNDESIDRLGFYSDTTLIGIAQILNVRARRGTFVHIRGGPVFKNWSGFKNCFDLLIQYAKDRNASFIRVNPPVLLNENEGIFDKFGFINTPIPLLDAEVSWILSLNKSEDELLMGMRKTTRYLIRKAQKNGVIIKKTKTKKAIGSFLKIYSVMTKEKGIVPHTGIEEEFNEFVKDDKAIIIEGYYKKKLLGAALILFYGDEGIYHHSAHLRETDIPVSYLMQWEAILESKKRGMKTYNFWGVEPTGNKKHPWYGLSLFKMGFGGSLRQFIRAKDYPLTALYYLTWFIETARRIKRYKTL